MPLHPTIGPKPDLREPSSGLESFPTKLQPLFQPKRTKVLYGGRGSAKSWSVARALLIIAAQRPIRVLCAREQQNSIAESVHRLLSDQITALGMSRGFEIQRDKIICTVTGSTFFFEGIRANVDRIKSYEGVDICWVEEAHKVSENSWTILIPTIRKAGSEIWITFNPDLKSDYTYKNFVLLQDPDTWVQFLSYRDNPWFPPELEKEMEKLKKSDYIKYLNVYEGHCRILAAGAVYGTEIARMMAEGRVSRVPYQPMSPVDVIMDLGWADQTTMWFRQRVGFEFHYIDYAADSQKSITHYLKLLQDKGYVYGTVWLPHDARAKEKGTGMSVEERVRKVYQTRIVRRLSINDGIDATRNHLALSWVDETKCSNGMEALGAYRYEVSEEKTPIGDLATFSKVPVHDWSSHAADGMRYSAISSQAPRTRGGAAEEQRQEALNGSAKRRERLNAQMGSEFGFGSGGDLSSHGTGWMR